MTLKDGFEVGKPGAAPRFAKLDDAGRAGAVILSNEDPHSGELCLKVTDGPQIKPSWQPHFYYLPRHTDGTSRVAFQLRLEERAALIHEWRNVAGSPYRTGPVLTVSEGWLSTDGKRLLQLPAKEWIGIEIEAKLGPQSSGTWNLFVSLPGKPAERFENLKFRHADAKELQWLGFIGSGVEAASWWLDDLVIENRD